MDAHEEILKLIDEKTQHINKLIEEDNTELAAHHILAKWDLLYLLGTMEESLNEEG